GGSYTWDSSSTWNLASDGSLATQAFPGGTYKAVFAAGTDGAASYTVTVSGTQAASGLSFEEGSPKVTLGAVNLVGGSINAGSGVNATIESVVTGGAGINKIGAGAVVLTANETYTGATTISEGTVQLGDGNGGGTLPTSSAITNNGTFVINQN